MSVKGDLIAARALIDTPEKWAQGPGTWGYDRNCSWGAMIHAGVGYQMDALAAALPWAYRLRAWFGGYWSSLSSSNIIRFNDSRHTKYADILALFDRAIAAAGAT